MNDNDNYLFIAVWGQMLGSLPYYIKDQQALARLDNAPPTAVYKKQCGKWKTISEIEHTHLADQLIMKVVNGEY